MSFGTMMSVTLTLAVVLGLMGVALRMLRRYTVGGNNNNGTLNMEVVQRLTLGQRQGIAVVRIGQRLLAVSMGEGGVHPIAELNPSDLPVVEKAKDSVVPDALNLRALTTSLTKNGRKEAEQAPQRVSYVAPIDDFNAVLNMALNDRVPALHH